MSSRVQRSRVSGPRILVIMSYLARQHTDIGNLSLTLGLHVVPADWDEMSRFIMDIEDISHGTASPDLLTSPSCPSQYADTMVKEQEHEEEEEVEEVEGIEEEVEEDGEEEVELTQW